METRFGSLTIPEDATVLTLQDSEFGILHAVKNQTPLFTTVPSKAIRTAIQKNTLSIKKLGKSFFATADTGKQIGIHEILQPGQQVLARKIDGQEGVLEVVVFENADKPRDDMPETGEGIKITSKGYVLAEDLRARKKRTRFKTVHNPIFQNDDLVADIRQNTFGDCFLLAGILTILNQPGGADYIRSMMLQKGHYTVVKLHDPNTFQPIYVRVKNSLYVEDGKEVVQHQATWVHILEKAYTALGYKKEKEECRVSYPAFKEIFGNGGSPALALSVLTGKPAVRTTIELDHSYPWQASDWMLCFNVYTHTRVILEAVSQQRLDLFDAFLKRHADGTYLDKIHLKFIVDGNTVDEKVEGLKRFLEEGATPEDAEFIAAIMDEFEKRKGEEKEQLFDAFLSYVNKYNDIYVKESLLITEVFHTIRQMAEAGKYVYDLLVQGKLNEFVELEKPVNTHQDAVEYLAKIAAFNPPPPETVLRHYQEFISQDKLRWSLPVGSGRYSEEANDLFEKLRAAEVLVVSTKNVLPGEKVPGLRPRHAYAVTGVFEEKVGTGATLKFVRVRNPWGHTGMDCDFEGKAIKEARKESFVKESFDKPEFKVELNHFIQYFSAYTCGHTVIAPMLNTAQKKSLDSNYQINKAVLIESNFFNRHWAKILFGMIAMAVLTAVGILTFGVAPLLLIGVPALIALAAAGTVLAGGAVGAGAGVAAGIAEDKITKQGHNSSYIYKQMKALPTPSSSVSRSSIDSDESSESSSSEKDEKPSHPNFYAQVVPSTPESGGPSLTHNA